MISKYEDKDIKPSLEQISFINQLENYKPKQKQELEQMAKTAVAKKPAAKNPSLTSKQIALIKAQARKRDTVQIVSQISKRTHSGLKMIRILDNVVKTNDKGEEKLVPVSTLVDKILTDYVKTRDAEIQAAIGVQTSAESENGNDEEVEGDDDEGEEDEVDEDEDEE